MSKHRWKKWTALEEKQLKALLEKKAPLQIIAVEIGHSIESVMVKMQRLGLRVVGFRKKKLVNPTTSTKVLEEMVDLDKTMLLLGGALERGR
jgi:hypothetical protein